MLDFYGTQVPKAQKCCVIYNPPKQFYSSCFRKKIVYVPKHALASSRENADSTNISDQFVTFEFFAFRKGSL